MHVKKTEMYEITLPGSSAGSFTFENESLFHLRNGLIDLRNQAHEAAIKIEEEMERRQDPTLTHISRLPKDLFG